MYQKHVLIGNLGGDAVYRKLENGNEVCSFSIATNESWLKDGEWQNKTTWWKCSYWGDFAENKAKTLTRGKKVVVESNKIYADTFPDKESGEPRASLVVKVATVKVVDKGNAVEEDEVEEDKVRDNW